MIFGCICLCLMIGIFTLVFPTGSQDDRVIETKSKKKNQTSALDRRVLAYRKKNPKLSQAETVKRVKMNLDYEPYTHTKTVSDLDTMTMLVNKYNRLPADYEPKDLIEVTNSGENEAKMRKEAADAFEAFVDAAAGQDIELSACSAYRSYSYQEELYNNGVASRGKDYADSYWTRPGFSEHQTGLAVDIRLDGNTGDLDAPRHSKNYPWLKTNAHKYGFVIRYPDNKKVYTLIEPESWHLRYVGKKLAVYLYDNHLTLDEYYGMKKES